ncbi:DEAD/DEAH box helicase [Pseudomonas sp. TCU-HL1]|uniref:DEAD/DEAH box helicase n=1 Tax=Pseudomonas sp. TCU-HL1 TaxID=1856685 RepID=UPI00083DDCDF|nr:DEAD/DEAH box helicase [Pseudomonas sp. TCU-HL1]AOE82753.1 serine/threonine protein kinase [Pseudomonas sp. TCU-HL1]
MSVPSLAIAALPDAGRAVLYALATSHAGRGKNSLLKLLQVQRVTMPDGRAASNESLSTLLDLLERAGWVTRTVTTKGYSNQLVEGQRHRVLLHLHQRRDARSWLEASRKHLQPANSWQGISPDAAQEALWLELLAGRLPGVVDSLQVLSRHVPLTRLHAIHPMYQMAGDAQGLELFSRLDDEMRLLLLEDYLDLCNQYLMPCRAAYELGLEHARSVPPNEEGELHFQLLLQALWRGDWHSLETLGRHGYSQLRDILTSLLKGDVARTLELIQSWMSGLRKQTGKRKIDLPPILNAVYALALIGGYQPTHRTALKQVLSTGIKAGYGPAYPILEGYFERLQGLAPQQRSLHIPTRLNGLDGLMLALVLYWQDAEPSRTKEWRNALKDYRQVLEDDHLAWLAAEFDALLAAQFSEPRRLADVHREAGLRPLLELQQRQESWQQALQALSQLKPRSSDKATPAKSARLAWFINLDRYMTRVEPREQKLGAKGQWSKGRVVALQRLVAEGDGMDFLNEQDRQAIRKIQVSASYYNDRYELPTDLALPALVGHPALFWMDRPDIRLELVAGQHGLHLLAEGERIHLRLAPDNLAGNSNLVIEKETPTRVVVYPINHELRQIAAIIGNGLSMPLSAKAQLIEAMGAIAPLLPIHSEIPELTAHLETLPADTRLYAHLLPLEAGLRLQLLVRPLTEGGWFVPGQGSRNLLGEREGKAVQVCRDLAAERQSLQRVLDTCPGLARAESDGREWQLQHPQDALQALSELKTLEGEALQCVWPEGERMRIKAHTGLGQLRLGLKQRGDWFVLQGGIDLDDGKILQLRQLLELLKASPGRFINLGDRDWLALDDRLRRQLEELGGLAERVTDRGLQLSPLNTPLLEALAGEAGAFEADRHWQTHLDRLTSMRRHQPQVPRTLLAQLRDYQQEGFCWLSRLAHWGVGACLADDMGLGKTIQILALLLERAAQGPQLVVAPTSVTLNWLAECARFAPSLRPRLYHEARSLEDLGPLDLVIVSYGLLQQDSEAFAARRWTSAVLDEAQAIKNAQTKRSQAAMTLQADFRMVATGTPLENHLGELWNLFRFINPGLLGSQDSFTARFASPIEQGDAAARRTLRKLIQPFILRRLKSQVLDELPARTEITHRFPLSSEEAHLYEALRQQALEAIDQLAPDAGRPLQVLAEITRLRRFCCHPSLSVPGSPLTGSKLQAFAEIIEELLANGHRALVFSQFVDHLQIVRAWLARKGIEHQYLDGSTPTRERQKRVEAFQAGSGDLFLISLKAGGSGLNLTAADYVIHLDPWWNPAVEDQASDRAHRMGQQRPVTIYRLVTENTIEEQIVALHQKKRDLADSLLEGGELSARLDAAALLRLLRGETD